MKRRKKFGKTSGRMEGFCYLISVTGFSRPKTQGWILRGSDWGSCPWAFMREKQNPQILLRHLVL
jgi:hypothetical protein